VSNLIAICGSVFGIAQVMKGVDALRSGSD